MKFSIEQVKKWAREGQAISPYVAMEILTEYECLLERHRLLKRSLGQVLISEVAPDSILENAEKALKYDQQFEEEDAPEIA